MKSLLILVSLSIGFIAFSQVDKKLKKIIGYDFIELEATDAYQRAPSGDVVFYPSNTFKGDTTGVSNDWEFLMFRDDITSKEGELFKLFRTQWVTNWAYNNFIIWVRDSIMLEKIYLNNDPTGEWSIPDELIGEMLSHPDIYYDSTNLEYQEFDPSQPEN